MNINYLKQIFEENKENFIESELDIYNEYDLKDFINEIITSNLEYDFDVSINPDKLFLSEFKTKYLWQYESEYFDALREAEITIENGCTLKEFINLGYNCSTLLSPNEDSDLEDIYITDSISGDSSYNFSEEMLETKVKLSSLYEDYDGYTCANIELENEKDWELFKPLLKKEKEMEL